MGDHEIDPGIDVSPSTVYRYFDTKEGIFLWDAHDDAVFEVFCERLEQVPPGTAMLEAMAAVFAADDTEASRSALEHLQFLAAVPELGAAQAVRLDMLRRERTDAIIASGWPEPEASVFAGAVGGGFTATLEAWLESGGADRLSSLLERTTEIIHDLDGLFLRRRQRTRGRT